MATPDLQFFEPMTGSPGARPKRRVEMPGDRVAGSPSVGLPRGALESGPASFSKNRRYRYTLWRTWDESKPTMMVIGLNPSTADESQLDPTLRRVLGFAHSWGYGAFVMTNLFAYRATNPVDMKASLEPIGPQNDTFLIELAFASKLVLAAWGTHGNYLGRADAVVKLLTSRGVNLACLDTTKGGFPKHPLYVPKETRPQVFRRAVVQDSR